MCQNKDLVTFNKKAFKNEKIILDNFRYIDCSFENCIMEYYGGSDLEIDNCTFINIELAFKGKAKNTLYFIKLFYKEMGEIGKEMINKTFEDIKK